MSYIYYNYSTMSTTTDIMTLRLPSKVKKDAMKVADDLGISLSVVITTSLKKFIRDKYITIGNPSEDHIDFYKNNRSYVEVNSSAEEVASFLRHEKKRHAPARKVSA